MPNSSWQGIFLSYRREDAAPYARLLQVELRERIPDARVFVDLDSIEAGLDFAELIEQAVSSCAVLVALIGREWATLADEEGNRRLDNPDDFVRFEVRTALERGVRVIPVLVDGAKPLRGQQLPADLHKLARLNAFELSYGRYQYDANRLLDLIERVLTAVSEPMETAPQAQEETDRQGREEADQEPTAIVDQGKSYRERGRYDEALADFTRAIELNPDDDSAIASRGETYRLSGRYDEALADFNRAIELNPDYAWAIASRGETYRDMGRYDEALADFNRAIELDPDYAWAITSAARPTD